MLGDELTSVETALRDLRGRMFVHHNSEWRLVAGWSLVVDCPSTVVRRQSPNRLSPNRRPSSRVHFVARTANESTKQRVFYWGLFEAATVVCVSLFQVWYLKRFFEVRRTL